MNGLAALVVAAAALVWIGQWISLRVGGFAGDLPLPPRVRARLTWWGTHRGVVSTACATVVAGSLGVGLLAA